MFIPFEHQSDSGSNRACGAACLAMVYRSFGKHVTQAEIWPQIARRNAGGSMASTTHLMVRDAQYRGLAAVAVQVRHPLQALRLCRDTGIRAILNTRLRQDSPLGHYLVLTDMDEGRVVVHDPFVGPTRVLAADELLRLWQVQLPNAEIAGNVLIGIADEVAAAGMCRECDTAIPAWVECPRCKAPVTLAPRRLLGCLAGPCTERMWTYLCCPGCDFMWTFSPPRTDDQAAAAAEAAARAADPWQLAPAFEAIDRFAAMVLSQPAAAAHPDVIAQLDHLIGGKEKLRLALTEALARQQTQEAMMQAQRQQAERAQEDQRRRERAANMPLDAADGPLLAEALLRSLGFTQ